MDSLKEFLTPKSYNRLSFLVVICWIALGTILLGIFAEMETSESRYFRCAVKSESKDIIQGKCLDQYDGQYNKVVPFYGFVIGNFSLVGIVCLTYSILIKSRVDQLDAIPDIESQRNPTRSRRLFFAYCCQLVFRLVLGALFIVLQTQVLYSSNFPSIYSCELPTSNEQSNRDIQLNRTTQASTAGNITTTYECHNPRATKKTFWATTVCVVNGVFMVLILIEIISILWRAKLVENSTTDLAFFKTHISSNNKKPLLLNGFVERMKERIRQDTEELDPLIPIKPGENDESRKLEFDKLHTNLVIYPGRAKYEFNEERHEIFAEYLKPGREHIQLKDIFVPVTNSNNQQIPARNILIVGRPGIGKTVLCRKICRDWASVDKYTTSSHEIPDSVEFAFIVNFRKFNSAENLNLQQLLNHSEHSTGTLNDEVYNYIISNPEKVLLIFDGLDECNDRLNIVNENQYGNNATEVMPFSSLYGKLASGKLLAGATVLTTTRPTAVSSVEHLSFCRTVEILGFTAEQVQEYVEKFMSHNSMAGEQIWNHISSNINLLSLCYVPVTCFIVCSYLQELLKSYIGSVVPGASLPTTLTDIYDGALRMFVLKHNPEYRNPASTDRENIATGSIILTVEETLASLGKIAFEATAEGRLIFESTEVKGLEESGLLHRMPDLQTGPFKHKPQFCFLHLTMQEFLAARHIVTTKDSEQLRSFVSEHIKEGKWHLVIQFVAGLLRDREMIAIFTDLLPVEPQLRRVYVNDEESEQTFWPAEADRALVLTLCKCIFEYNKITPYVTDIFAKKIPCSDVVMSNLGLTPADCAALIYLLQNVKGISLVDVSQNFIGPLGCVEINKLFRTGHLTTLSVNSNGITDEGVKHLCDASSGQLANLYLINNSITDEGVKLLCDALSKEACKLTYLNLGSNSIADQGVKHLCHALSKEACKLTNLKLCSNSITDQGIKHLGDALSKEACKLTNLNLFGNSIIDQGVKYLCDALSKEACKLTYLNLSSNSITDQGVKYLCHALSKEACKLTKLNLGSNSITDQDVKHLCDALSKEACTLTNLDLSCNSITYRGVKHLCDALSKEACKLTKLNLVLNSIPDQGVKHLCDALSKEACKLTKLNLGSNSITDQGVKHLCDALSKEPCKLTNLDLSFNSITDQNVKHLCDTFSKEACKLTNLNLTGNSITDQGVKHLCDALSKEACKLTNLTLTGNSITDQGVKHLCVAFSKEACKLTYLNLTGNSITKLAVKHLFDALSKGDCKLFI